MTAREGLQELLGAVEGALRLQRPSVADVTAAVTSLLEFLSAPVENTDENCKAVDSFIVLRIVADASASRHLACLPAALRGIVEDMGNCLHDTHSSPEIAKAFESTPAQLLERIQRFQALSQG